MTPETFLARYLTAWLAAFAMALAYQAASGKIRLTGLLTMDGQRPSPERLQLLAATLAALFAFVQSAVTNHRFPIIPDNLLMLFAASHLAYLGGKTQGR